MRKIISIKNLTKTFKNDNAINNLSIEVEEGEIYGLLGSNGAGKSTTINILLGFLKPDSGITKINDINTTINYNEARKYIGYISENVSLYPYLSGVENLDYFSKLNGKNHSQKEIQTLLNECGLNNKTHHKRLETYSKGMRQKVGIAIALAKQAKVYLMDEPASGLDPLASNELSSLLKKLSSEGSSILMASHDIFRVRETCDRIGIIKKGELVKEMSTSNVSTNELEKIYIDYMQN
jgi:ABC-2 type transport system ATP-binding protein|tara:strand:- start:3840 stop:4550 length:711 start_codon:yes stop_codon:yes gene_type:complete